MAATVATLQELARGEIYTTFEKRGRQLMDGIQDILKNAGIPARVQGFPGIFHVAFGICDPIKSFRDTFAADRARYVRFTTALLERGVRALERGAWFLSSQHDETIPDQTLATVELAARVIR